MPLPLRVGAIGYVSVVLMPFLKYPATPPAVGSGDTIDQRTALYLKFPLISLATAAACTAVAFKLIGSHGPGARRSLEAGRIRQSWCLPAR